MAVMPQSGLPHSEAAAGARKAIFVLGMHRSGSSALTRVLSLLGASLPRRILPAGPGNETGHWEPEAAVALHDRLLEAAGTSVNGLDGPSEAWLASDAAGSFLDPMRALIRAEFAEERLFVFKDPRSALVFPLWQRALAELDIACLPIVMLRNPREVAASLVQRQVQAMPGQSWTEDRAALLWLRYTLAAERFTRGAVRTFCDYPTLLRDWPGTVERLGRDLGIAWPRPPALAAGEIAEFLEPSRRHHRVDGPLAARGGIWATWIAPAYEALRPAAHGGDPNGAVLDAVAGGFADACAAILQQPEAGAGDAPLARCGGSQAGGGPRLCLVVTPSLIDAGLLADLVGAAAEAKAALTIVTVGSLAATALAALPGEVEVQPCGRSTPAIEPGFMAPTVELYRQLRGQGFDAVLFPDHGALGYASMVAKQAGLGFAGTTLGVVALGPSRCLRERARRFPGDLVTLSIEHLERQAIEGADLVLHRSPDVAAWMRDAGWTCRSAAEASAGGIAGAVRDLLRPAQATARIEEPDGGVTVVITHYEQPHLLEQNLQALTRQTDPDFSVLVVDDGSQGADARHCLATLEERYRGLRLRLLRQENRYLGAARNAGLRAAETEFVIFLDDDNIAFPTMIATLRRAARRMRADIVTCGIRHFHDAKGVPDPAAPGNGPDQVFAAGPVLVGAVHNCFGDASGIYRRSMVERIGGFHERRGVTYEDWQLHLRAVAAGCRLVSLPEPLVWYRVRGDSMLRTTNRYDNARVIAETIRALPAAMLEPLADLLIGLEEEQGRQNRAMDAVRAVAAARIAALSEVGLESARRAQALEQLAEARNEHARTAEGYARSLEAALAEAAQARETAETYARSLEEARARAEAYARELEAAIARLNGPMPP